MFMLSAGKFYFIDKRVVFCNVLDDNPFMAGAFHGVTGGDAVINVGVSGSGTVHHVVSQIHSTTLISSAKL